MVEAAAVISLIQRVSSYNDKRYLLKKNENVPGLKEILKHIYNPYSKTGISTAKFNTILSMNTTGGDVTYAEMIKYLKRNQTGSDADLAMAARFINCAKATNEPFVEELAKAIITQDLQIGVTAKTLNTVYGKSFIPTVGCMLGTKLESIQEHKIEWPCIVTEKIDGARRILLKQDGVSRVFTRSGHEDTGLVDIMREAEHLPDNRMYDGELTAIGTFKDCIALRQATSSRASVKGVKSGLSYNMFDMMHIDEFYAGKSDDTAAIRKLILGATLMDESIKVLDKDWFRLIQSYGIHKELEFIKHVPILGVVNNLREVEPIVDYIWANGGEGVMLNTTKGYYEVKRSKSLIKMKNTQEVTLEVVDFIEHKNEDMLGAFVVEYEGNRVGVSGRLPMSLRREVWQNQTDYLGRKIEIDCFGISTNQTGTRSLNCPIFKRFAGDEE